MAAHASPPKAGERLTFESIGGGLLTGFVADVRGPEARLMDVLEPLEGSAWRWSEWVYWDGLTDDATCEIPDARPYWTGA